MDAAKLILAAGIVLVIAGCRSSIAKKTNPESTPAKSSIGSGAFENIAEKAGIRFTFENGEDGKYMLVATTPGGCAFLDYDQDGLLDIFLVQAGPTPDKPRGIKRPPCKLYRNAGSGSFRDATSESGIDKVDQGYAQAVAVGDYDNDGYPDLYITAYGGNRLLHNQRDGRFTDVTETAGVGDRENGPHWATSASWVDYDRDGKLDLFVLHYTTWDLKLNRKCINSNKQATYCSPEVYDERASPRMYRNLGGGRFEDVSIRTGLDKVHGRALGSLSMDYDQDGWTDLYVACDITPNLLLRNLKGQKFHEVGLETGVAYGADAAVLSGMGVTAGDYENKGWQSLIVTNFSGQPNSVYRAVGGQFEDATYQSGIGSSSMDFLAFGVEFLDYDNDGLLDVVVGNGHVDPFISDIAPNTTYRQRKLLYKNLGGGEFRDQVDALGDMTELRVTRGLAIGDYDNDGRMDVLDNSHNMPAALYHNSGKTGNFVTLRLEGVKSNRDAVGALVWVTAGGRRRLAEVRDGSSYASTSDRRLHFGIGDTQAIDLIEVRWPSGARQSFKDIAGGKFYLVREGENPVPDPLIK